jgi:maltose alpha-D-glucosyltransferase/alpha-amylase
MLRSFDYAARHALAGRPDGPARADGRSGGERWLRFWYRWVCAAFLRGYLAVESDERVPLPDREHLPLLLDAYLLERAMYELGYELEERPEWVAIPLLAILELLEDGPGGAAPRDDRAGAS